MRRTVSFFSTLLCLAIAMPISASEGYFDGKTEPIDGKQTCWDTGMHVKFQVTSEGAVLGGAVTFQPSPGGEIQQGSVVPISSDGFHGSLEQNGGLHASFHAGRHAELVTIDGAVSDGHFEGIVQKAECRYRLILDRH
jgi:hypothetical protein